MSQLNANIVDTVQDYEIVKINQNCHCIWLGSNLYFLSKKTQFQVQLRNENARFETGWYARPNPGGLKCTEYIKNIYLVDLVIL